MDSILLFVKKSEILHCSASLLSAYQMLAGWARVKCASVTQGVILAIRLQMPIPRQDLHLSHGLWGFEDDPSQLPPVHQMKKTHIAKQEWKRLVSTGLDVNLLWGVVQILRRILFFAGKSVTLTRCSEFVGRGSKWNDPEAFRNFDVAHQVVVSFLPRPE